MGRIKQHDYVLDISISERVLMILYSVIATLCPCDFKYTLEGTAGRSNYLERIGHE